MVGSEQWQDNWGVVGPAGAVRIDLGRSVAKRRLATESVRELSNGTSIVLCARAPGAKQRCRRFASRAGIELDREYLAFPSVRSPAYLVEDAPTTGGFFVGTILVAPPRIRFATLMEGGLAALRALSSQRLIRLVAPGRIVVGTRI
jgi:hypothetical protein